ncbi:MAG: branched-chain amino acid ABC transporter substrate-binding protein [Solirubrobacteraceae bacterium]|nr:branched-chain amino acid ABC transporter substrate-binding protein [Solirubrobacteraceae bacterium]
MFRVASFLRLPALLLVVGTTVLLVALLAGCGSDEPEPPKDGVSGSRTLTIYASVPLQGEMREESQDAVDAIKLALADEGGRVGAFTINLVVLDDASAEAGGWDRERTLDNSTDAARDRNAIAVLGEWDSDASALSIPILNEAELLQVSPASTYVGLTRRGGVAKGEPEKYYPSGRRNFGRVVPADDLQGRVIVDLLRKQGAKSVYLTNDRSLYGKGLIAQVRKAAEAARMEIVGDDSVQPAADDYESLATNLQQKRPGAFVYGGSVRNGAVQLFRDVAAVNPRLPLVGGDALVVNTFVSAIGDRAARTTWLTSPGVGVGDYTEKGRRFAARFETRFGHVPSPMAIYAYAGMSTLMHTIREAGPEGNLRQAVTDQFFGLDVRDSVLGDFTIDERGDTSLRRYGIWRIADGELDFERAVDAPR